MVGMTWTLATTPSSPAYATIVKCVSDQTSHSLPRRYLETSPAGLASSKQVIRPRWLLAPKPPLKYPLTERSPNLGLAAGGTAAGAGEMATGDGASVAAAGSMTGAGCSASFGSSVL